jgi:ATP-dependent exoDNAse (exonuclease V) alpha subunit
MSTALETFKNSVAWEDGEERSISKNDMQLAYCMTVHKAQGSEFSDVCRRSQHTDHGQRT